MVDEGAIREALLTSQEKLIAAYEAGPAALDLYFLDFEALKKQILDASRLGHLSSDTLQLAAKVVGGVHTIAQSFIALDNAAADALEKTEGNLQNLLFSCGDDEDELEEDESHYDPSTDSDASGEEADESDKEDGGDDSDADYRLPSSGSDEESDLEEEPDAPKWDLLRDWLLDNMAYPFAHNEADHTDVLRLAKISYPAFLHWLKQMRENMQWDEFLQTHAKGDPRQFRHILSAIRGDFSCVSPATLAAVSQMRTVITDTYDDTIPQWWGDVVELVEGMEKMFWEGAAEIVRLESDETLTTDESDEDDATIQVPLESEIAVQPLGKMSDAAASARSSSLSMKRKAQDMATCELPMSQESSWFHISLESEPPAAKRRRQEVTLSESRRASPSAHSEVYPSSSGSSRATSCSRELAVSPSSSVSLVVPDAPIKEEPFEAFLTLQPSSPTSSPPISRPKDVQQPSVLTSLPHEETEFSEESDMKTIFPTPSSNSQAQIPTGIEPLPPYIRSNTVPFDRKRKRKSEVRDHVDSEIDPPASSIPNSQHNMSTPNLITCTDHMPSSILLAPNYHYADSSVPDHSSPHKKRRLNCPDSLTPNARPNVPALFPSNKYKSYPKVVEHKKLKSRSWPPATDPITPVATSPSDAQIRDSDGINHLVRILEEINTTIPWDPPLDPVTQCASAESSEPHNSLHWVTSAQASPTIGDSLTYHHLSDPGTPLLSIASSNGESPCSCVEVATPVTTADLAQEFYPPSDFHDDDPASSTPSAQIFDDHFTYASYRHIAG